MLIRKISIRSLVCIFIGSLFTLGVATAKAEEPVVETKSTVKTYNSIDEIPAELLEKLGTMLDSSTRVYNSIEEIPEEFLKYLPPDLLEKSKPGDTIRKIIGIGTKVKMYNKNGEEEEINPEVLAEIEANPELLKTNPEILGKGKPVKVYKNVSVIGADSLSDAELKEMFPELLAAHDGIILRSKSEHDVALGEIMQKVTAPVLTVVSQNGNEAVLKFDNNEGQAVQFDVVDINGNIVKTITAQGDSFTVSELASGTYFVKSKENPNTQAKIVITK